VRGVAPAPPPRQFYARRAVADLKTGTFE
jgi:hypothetical protein